MTVKAHFVVVATEAGIWEIRLGNTRKLIAIGLVREWAVAFAYIRKAQTTGSSENKNGCIIRQSWSNTDKKDANLRSQPESAVLKPIGTNQ